MSNLESAILLGFLEWGDDVYFLKEMKRSDWTTIGNNEARLETVLSSTRFDSTVLAYRPTTYYKMTHATRLDRAPSPHSESPSPVP